MDKKRTTKPPTWEWRESKTAKRQDELRFGDQVFATLRWEGRFSRLAYARSPAGQWTFDRPRLLSRDVEIRGGQNTSDSEALIAVYHARWTAGGKLEFVDGYAYDWAPTNFWQTRWAFFEADTSPPAEDKAIIAFDDVSSLFESRDRVTFGNTDLSKAEVGLLATLGRYLMELWRQDTAAIAATTAVTASIA